MLKFEIYLIQLWLMSNDNKDFEYRSLNTNLNIETLLNFVQPMNMCIRFTLSLSFCGTLFAGTITKFKFLIQLLLAYDIFTHTLSLYVYTVLQLLQCALKAVIKKIVPYIAWRFFSFLSIQQWNRQTSFIFLLQVLNTELVRLVWQISLSNIILIPYS